jgi:hypothetical protein
VVVARVAGVSGVNGIFLGCDPGGLLDPVPLLATELPELRDLSVKIGDPLTREQMLIDPALPSLFQETTGGPSEQTPPSEELPRGPATSTPVVPKSC